MQPYKLAYYVRQLNGQFGVDLASHWAFGGKPSREPPGINCAATFGILLSVTGCEPCPALVWGDITRSAEMTIGVPRASTWRVAPTA